MKVVFSLLTLFAVGILVLNPQKSDAQKGMTCTATGNIAECPCEHSTKGCQCKHWSVNWEPRVKYSSEIGRSKSEVLQKAKERDARQREWANFYNSTFPNDPKPSNPSLFANPNPPVCSGCKSEYVQTITNRKIQEATDYVFDVTARLMAIHKTVNSAKQQWTNFQKAGEGDFTILLPSGRRNIGDVLREYNESLLKAIKQLRDLRDGLTRDTAINLENLEQDIASFDTTATNLQKSTQQLRNAMGKVEQGTTNDVPQANVKVTGNEIIEAMLPDGRTAKKQLTGLLLDISSHVVDAAYRRTNAVLDTQLPDNVRENYRKNSAEQAKQAELYIDSLHGSYAQWAAQNLRELSKKGTILSQYGDLAEAYRTAMTQAVQQAIERLEKNAGAKSDNQKAQAPTSMPNTPLPSVVSLRQVLSTVNKQTSVLPLMQNTVSDLTKAPASIQKQYLRYMSRIETKNIEQLEGVLAPDYFCKRVDGQVLPLSRWKATHNADFGNAPRVRLGVRIEAIQQNGDEILITANTTVQADSKQIHERIRDTWIQNTSIPILQSSEILPSSDDLAKQASEISRGTRPGKWPDDAEVILKSAVTLNPQSVSAHYWLSLIYWQKQQYSFAKDELLKVVELAPQNPDGWMGLGEYYKSIKDYAEAETAIKKGVELSPDKISEYTPEQQIIGADYQEKDGAMAFLASFYEETSRVQDAESTYKDIIDLFGKKFGSHLRLGDFYMKQRRFAEAENCFRNALRVVTKDKYDTLRCMNSIGKALVASKKYAEAETFFRDGIALIPPTGNLVVDSTLMLEHLGEVLYLQGKYEQAEVPLRQICQVVMEHHTTFGYKHHTLLALTLYKLNRKDEAKKEAERAIRDEHARREDLSHVLDN